MALTCEHVRNTSLQTYHVQATIYMLNISHTVVYLCAITDTNSTSFGKWWLDPSPEG